MGERRGTEGDIDRQADDSVKLNYVSTDNQVYSGLHLSHNRTGYLLFLSDTQRCRYPFGTDFYETATPSLQRDTNMDSSNTTIGK